MLIVSKGIYDGGMGTVTTPQVEFQLEMQPNSSEGCGRLL